MTRRFISQAVIVCLLTAVVSVASAEAEKTSNPVHWTFDEGNGQQVIDKSGKNPGMLGKTPEKDKNDPEWKPGKSGKCLYFDNQDYAKIPYEKDSSDSLNFGKDDNFTIELWLKGEKSKQKGRYSGLITKYPGCAPSWILWISNRHGNIEWRIRDKNENQIYLRSVANVLDNKWHHVKVVRDRATKKLYVFIDGELDNQVIDTSEATFVNKARLLIGETHLRYHGPFTGYIDEVKISKQGLPANFRNSGKEKGFDWKNLKVNKNEQLVCKKVKTSPVIDGKLDDPCWQKAQKVIFSKRKKWELPSEKTVAAVAVDDKNFYIAAKCYESAMREIIAKAHQYNGPVFNDDSIEIFLDTNHDKATYFHLAANSNGATADDGQLNGNWTAKATKGNDYWNLEVAIPLENLIDGNTKNNWTINLNRNEMPRKELSAWRPTFGSFHRPNMFGEMQFKSIDLPRIYAAIVKNKLKNKSVLAETGSCIVQAESPNNKILKDEPIQGLKEISLHAAKNEYEPFQLLVSPKGNQTIDDISLKFSNLKEPGGNVIAKSNLEYFEVGYIGAVPDVLYPPDKFTGAKGKNRLFWILLKVPENAAPGEYKGFVEVKAGKDKPKAIPYRVKVWNFQMPEKVRLRTCLFSFVPTTVVKWYGHPIGSEKFFKIIKGGFESFARHHVDPGCALPGYWFDYGTFKYNMKIPKFRLRRTVLKFKDGIYGKEALAYFDKWAGFWVKNGLNLNYFIMSPSDRTLKTPEQLINLERFWNVWYPHLKKKGWASKIYIRPFRDEFKKWSDAKEGRDRALLVKKIAPEVKVLATTCGGFHKQNEYLKDVIDIWSLNAYMGNKSKIAYFRKLREKGALICPYIHGHIMINNSGMKLRRYFWQLWQDYADGCTLWCVNGWTSYNPELGILDKKPDGTFKLRSDKIQFGAGGILLWPGKDGVLDSVRWELVREGIEDYEYIHLLEDKLADRKLSGPMKSEAEKILKNLRNNFREELNDSDRLNATRITIGNMLEKLNIKMKK